MNAFNCSTGKSTEYYLDLRKSILLVKDFISSYNQDRPLRQQLRANHQNLMYQLLEIQRIVLWKVQSGSIGLIPGTALPRIATNNVQLGEEVKCSARTIQNLRQRLQEAGLIRDEVWHGSKANYELQLNTEVIFLARRGDQRNWIGLFCTECSDQQTTADTRRPDKGNLQRHAPRFHKMWRSTMQAVKIRPDLPSESMKFLPSYEEKNTLFKENFSSNCTLSLPDTNQLNQLEIDPCGKRAETDEHRTHDHLRHVLTGYETDSDLVPPLSLRDISPDGEIPPRVARRPPVDGEWGEGEIGGGGDGVPQTFAEVVVGLPDRIGRRIFREVAQVWAVAQEELYAGQWIADAERERAKARLAEYYIYASPKRYTAGTAEICERIRLVRKWIDRGRNATPSLERWVPIPSIYFDYRNHRGFGRTKAWFHRHNAKRRAIKGHIAVTRAVHKYRRSLQEADGTAGPIEVYRKLIGRLQEHSEEAVMDFCRLIGNEPPMVKI
ncbi:hypothetical protein [Flavilitoribacter nigricans]|uniref:Uncharacterized protein n=1 Tax=Flavilitoribacter nigricans (strain ATCC 23147 / DSM 23189 / NBRC 102662 / NCIMB 1420 / SS-2) TaxID=1122177 RepID=A0A2D0NI25_FLAN2|nr:hypothetical protein [Flavilitoribacter nigricans]PHN07819.1 hypothetical protein CRP01_04670 [Flavilitoribacter nigricans DSM 23189 = NBRC 102662]